jgi:ubiquinone/menaquinone biosynthesis C-methylase UbiE
MKELWDARYATSEFVYGKEPNLFFKNTIDDLNITGKVLLPAEGEGRNAVYAAKKRLSVSAFDFSSEAKKKALSLAQSEDVQIHYVVGEISDLDLESESFDTAALIYAHFPPHVRKHVHGEVAKMIKPGGLVILEAFSKNNLENKLKNPSSGGPDKIELLYSKEDLELDFQNFHIIKLEEAEISLNEGKLHTGSSRVIRFIGKRR